MTPGGSPGAPLIRTSRSRLRTRAAASWFPRAQGAPMPKFAANLTFLFRELPFLDRFEAAAEAGFTGRRGAVSL